MEIADKIEPSADMSIVLHEVPLCCVCCFILHLEIFFWCAQDKKYYPTAEEVYGPDVEVCMYPNLVHSVRQ